MPRFFLNVPRPSTSGLTALDLSAFKSCSKGLTIRGAYLPINFNTENFIELETDGVFNIRVAVEEGELVISLMHVDRKDAFPPVGIELISIKERVTAELLQFRTHYLRQLYAIALLIADDREDEVGEALNRDLNSDLELYLVRNEDKLLIRNAKEGSLMLTIVSVSKRGYQAILYVAAMCFEEGRGLLLRRVDAGTQLVELEVRAKRNAIVTNSTIGIIDLANKIERIKDPNNRKLVQERFIACMEALLPFTPVVPAQTTIEHSQPVAEPWSMNNAVVPAGKSAPRKVRRRTPKKDEQ